MNVLSHYEISEILSDPIVQTNRDYLSDTQNVAKFTLSLPDSIKSKLENSLSINLSQNATTPMRWIRGDTLPHIDRGEEYFENTYLVYLTDSVGDLIIDGQAYPITAGTAYVFNEGLEHSTINTGNSDRLMIGPMSESGFGVGAAAGTILYYLTELEAANDVNYNANSIGVSDNTIQTLNGISSWVIYTNLYGTDPSPNGGPYVTGSVLVPTGIYYLYPYVAPSQPLAQPRTFSMRRLFTDNSRVYYKTNSLSTGGGGSGVRNSRHKKRRT
jgi:hypothetical protein